MREFTILIMLTATRAVCKEGIVLVLLTCKMYQARTARQRKKVSTDRGTEKASNAWKETRGYFQGPDEN